MPTVLMVGDVAGVGTSLSRLVDRQPEWNSVKLDAPMYAARAAKPIKAVAQVARAVHLATATWLACREHRPDVVHLHWARMAPFVCTAGAPLIVHAHGTDVRAGLGNRMTQSLVDRSLARATVVVATPDLLDQLPDATYLPNPIDTDRFAPNTLDDDIPVAARERAGATTILVFSRLSEVKGADVIVRAIEQLDIDRAEVRILGLAWDAPYEAAAEAAGIELIPLVAHDRVAELLEPVSVVVGQQRMGVPSLSELESMAAGKPVLADCDPQRYDEPPPVVSTADAAALAAMISQLLGDPTARSRLGEAGRTWVIRHHGHDAVAARLIELYQQAGVAPP